VFPTVHRIRVRPIDHYGLALLAAALARARRSAESDDRALTPGVFNSAYFEHTFLRARCGIELVEGRDLIVHDNVVHMRTTAGWRRRHLPAVMTIIIRWRSGPIHGWAPGPLQRAPRRQRVDHQCHRHRRR
jgi:hypothetical protein